MNSWIGIGNLASDVNVKMTQSGTAMGTFRLAVNSGWGDKKETAWLHIITFGKTAENCERFLSKGRKVCIRGRITTGSYEKNGQKIYTTDIIAEDVEFLSANEPQQDRAQRDEPQQKPQPQQQEEQESMYGMPQGFVETEEEDIPF